MTTPPEHRPADDQREFLAGYDPSKFAHYSVTVDVALVSAVAGELCALLIRRNEHPCGLWPPKTRRYLTISISSTSKAIAAPALM